MNERNPLLRGSTTVGDTRRYRRSSLAAGSPRFPRPVFSRFVQPVELSAAGSVSAAAGCVASRRVCCFGCRFSCLCGFSGGNWIAATHHLSSPGKETVASAAASSGVSGGVGAGLQ